MNELFEALTTRVVNLERKLGAQATFGTSGNFTGGSVPFGGSGGNLTQDNANLFWDNTGKVFKVGAQALQQTTIGFSVNKTDTNADASNTVIEMEAWNNPGATQLTAAKRALYVIQTLQGSGGSSANGAIQAISSDVRHSQTAGTIAAPHEMFLAVYRVNAAGSNANEARGFRAIPILSSTGGLGTWKGFAAQPPSVTSSGVLTTAYGFFADDHDTAGVTTGWAFYQNGSAGKSYFAGNIRIGDLAVPANDFEIVGTGGSRIYIRIDDTSASSDTYIKLENSGNNISSGSFYIQALKGATEQFSVRGDGRVNVAAAGFYAVNSTQVVTARQTGWALATGTATRTTFATSTVTLPQLAERVKALIDDLHATAGHGLIGA